MQYRAVMLLGILALSIFTFLQSPAVAEDEWKIYKLTHDGQVFKIPYKITNGELQKIEQDPDFYSMTVYIESGANDGTIEITVPRNLFDSKIDHQDDDFIVLVGIREGVTHEEVEYEEVKSPCFRTLSVKFPAGYKRIEIIGSGTGYSPTGTAVPPVYVATDKNNYEVGEDIKISGCTSLALDDKEVILELLNPEGRPYRTVSVAPNMDGSFLTTLVVEGEEAINGTYTAKATYAGQTATSTFVIPEFQLLSLIIFASAISFILATRIMARLKP